MPHQGARPSPSTLPLSSLPDDVMAVVCDVVGHIGRMDRLVVARQAKTLRRAVTACRTLQSLAFTCRSLRHTLDSRNPTWLHMLEALDRACGESRDFAEGLRRVRNDLGVTAKRALELTAGTGCELCGARRIRKVHWPFLVRCCQQCLRENTVSDYRLDREFRVNRGGLQGVPHTVVEIFRPRIGRPYTLRFYWKTDPQVCRLLRQRWGLMDEDVVKTSDLLEEITYRAMAQRHVALRCRPRSNSALANLIRRQALQDPRLTPEILEWLEPPPDSTNCASHTAARRVAGA
jgi:hypothetical protein